MIRPDWQKLSNWPRLLENSWGRKLTLTAVIVALAGLMRLREWGADPILGRDEILYINMIRQWHMSGGQTLFNSGHGGICPMFPYLGSVLMDCGIDAESGAKWINVVSGVLLLLPVLRGALLVFRSWSWALLAILLTAFSPPAITLSALGLRDSLAILIAGICGCLLLEFFVSRRWRHLLLGCAFTAVGVLTRLECAELIVLCGVGVGVYFLQTRHVGRTMMLAGVAVMVFVLTFFMLLFVMRLAPGALLESLVIRGLGRIA